MIQKIIDYLKKNNTYNLFPMPEDTNKDIDVSKNKKRIESPKFIKKDPGLIKLPNKTEIDKKAFQKKMAC